MQSRMQPLSAVTLDDMYAQTFPNSRELYTRAQKIFPDGVTHDNRRMQPFPIYVERAAGAYSGTSMGIVLSITGWGMVRSSWVIARRRFARR